MNVHLHQGLARGFPSDIGLRNMPTQEVAPGLPLLPPTVTMEFR
jgi:hypothetical protein